MSAEEMNDKRDAALPPEKKSASCSSSRLRLCYRDKMILAPMVKIGTTPMRLLALDYGADIVYTEEIIDWRLLRSKRVENPILDTVDYIDKTDDSLILRVSRKERGKLVLQIGTSDAGRAVRVAKMVVNDVDGLDVNMGCPKSFSLKGGMGAALLSQPDKIKDILTSLIGAVGSQIPVTCKIRILNDLDKTLDLVRMIVGTGVEALAVHGRTKEERPNNENHLDFIQAVVKAVGNDKVPIIANGGSSNNRDSQLNTFAGIKEFWKESGASSVMIARAAEWNPSVFSFGDRTPVMEIINKYLDHAIHYDYTFTVVKYTAQQILGSLQESELGKKFLASSTMRDLCQVFGRAEELDRRQAWIKQESERLGFGLESSEEVTMRNGTLSENRHVQVRTLKQLRGSQQEGDVAMLKQFEETAAQTGDDQLTWVCETNARFVRGHYANDTDIPKAKLLLWARQNCCDKDDVKAVAEFHPVYKSWTRDKSFRSIVVVNLPAKFKFPEHGLLGNRPAADEGVDIDRQGEGRTVVFSSLMMEKNRRYSEQAAAKVAVDCIIGIGCGTGTSNSSAGSAAVATPSSPEPKEQTAAAAAQEPDAKRLKTNGGEDKVNGGGGSGTKPTTESLNNGNAS